MELSLYKTHHSANTDSIPDYKTKISLRLPRITLIEQNKMLFQFLPTRQYSGMIEIFHVGVGNGITLYFTKKAVLDRVLIPKGTVQ